MAFYDSRRALPALSRPTGSLGNLQCTIGGPRFVQMALPLTFRDALG
jgi:hypothetical protein